MSKELRRGDRGVAEGEEEDALVVCMEDSVVVAVTMGVVDERGESAASDDRELGLSSDLLWFREGGGSGRVEPELDRAAGFRTVWVASERELVRWLAMDGRRWLGCW
jgi:hypothetical protein